MMRFCTLVLLISCCLAVHVSCQKAPWRPVLSPDWDSQISTVTSLAPEVEFRGTMHNQDSQKRARLDLTGLDQTITQVLKNNTAYVITFDQCRKQYSPWVFGAFDWVTIATAADRDAARNCYPFVLDIPTLLNAKVCYANPTTPVYQEVVVNDGLNIRIDFMDFTIRNQPGSIYDTPSNCTEDSSTSFAKSEPMLNKFMASIMDSPLIKLTQNLKYKK